MSLPPDLLPCPGCGALFPNIDYPTHRYLGASPGCWAVFNEVLAREFNGWSLHAKTHRLTVDAYAAQHPGVPSPQSIQSVAVHLVALYLVLERELGPGWVWKVMGEKTKDRDKFVWLEPPASLGKITIQDVAKAENPNEHGQLVGQWALSVWEAWSPHHATIRAWATS